MKTNKSASPDRFWTSLVLSVAIFVALNAPASLFAQTSEPDQNAAEKESRYSLDQVPGDVSPCSDCNRRLAKDEQLIQLLQVQNSRLKAENAKLKAGK